MESLSKELEAIEQKHGLSQAARDRLNEIEMSSKRSGSGSDDDDEEEEEEEMEVELKGDELIVSWIEL